MKNKVFFLSVLLIFEVSNLCSQQLIEQTGITIAGVNQGSVAWGDYDKDGYPDILLTGWDGLNPVSKVYRNNGDNTFTDQAGIVLPGVSLSSVAWGDYDNDGDLDILLTGTTNGETSGAISKIFKNTNGVFTDLSAGLPGVYFGNVSWNDFDRDGRLDVLLTGMSDGAERICKIFKNLGNGNFQEVTGTPFSGVQYSSASWGDYDNDGYPDLFVSGQNSTQDRETKIYHNNGNGTFSNPGITLKAVYYSSSAWGDYNSDGLLDILYSGEDINGKSLTLVYKNMGNSSFVEQNIPSLTGVKMGSVAWGDYNNDGKLDIFFSGRSNTARISKIYTNCTDSTFCNTPESLTGLIDCSISIADYDNDNDLDLVTTGMDPLGSLVSKIYRNNSTTPNIAPAAPANLTYLTTGTTSFISWDRITGDETSVNSISYNVGIGRSAGTSAFVASHSGSTGMRRIAALGNAFLESSFVFKKMRWDTTYFVSVQAIDNNYKGSSFSLLNNMKITPVQSSGLRASYITTTSIRIKWIRGNGDRCIVFAKEGSSGSALPVNNTTYFANPVFREGSPLGATGWYCIYKGEADSVTLSGLETQKDYSIHVIEYQGEIGSELYATDINENLGVFSTGLFTNQPLAAMVGLRRSSVAWGDFNNDGFLDALISGQNLPGLGTTKIYQNNADNTFTELIGLTLPGVYYSSVGWGDYNNDGFLDILITGLNDENGPISKIFKNNGNNTFTEQTDIVLTGVYNSSALWGDYDNDADLDLIIAGLNMDIGLTTKVYRNDGNNVFTVQTGISLPGIQNGSIALGDYDNNGFLDLLMTGFIAGNGRISKIFKNTGNNNFQEQTSISLPGASLSSGAWGDYDNDGNLDILLAGATGDYPNFNQFTKIYHNNGNNTFTELSNSQLSGISQGSLAWGDYNNDGFLDVLITGYTGASYIFRVYENNGNQTFTDNPQVQVPGAIGCDVKWADYDNDGDLDVLISGYTGALISRVYKNNTFMIAGNIKPNLRPGTPSGLKSTVTMGDVNLYWDPITNDETPVANMSYNVRIRLENTGQWFYSPQSLDDGNRSLVSLGNVQLNKFFNVKNPDSGKYFWQVQAVDQGFQGSPWSTEESFLIKNTQAYFKTDTVCLGSVTTFTDQSIVTEGIASLKWDFKDGTTSVLLNPTHTYVSAGTYGVKLLVTSSTGTKDSLTQNVIVKARPRAAFTAPNVCIGTATQLTNTSTLTGLTASTWTWSFGDGQNSTIQNPGTHNYALSGTYQAKLKTVATNGCSDSITKDVIVAKYPETSISVLGDFQTVDGKLTFCDGLSLRLDAKSDPLYTYQWRKDDNNLTGAENNSYAVSSNSGIYTARITNTLANCVSVSEAKTINIKPTPAKPVIISDNYTTGDCLGEDPVKLSVDQTATGYNYTWFRNEVPLENFKSSSLEGFPEPGNFTVTAEQNGCFAKSNVFQVTSQGAPDKPLLFARGPNKWYIGSNVTSASDFKWYYNNNLIAGANENYYVPDQDLGTYYLRIGNSDGCYTRSDDITIPTDKYLPSLKKSGDTNPFAGLKIYPNPSPGIFTLEMDNELFGELNISIISQSGREILKIKFNKSTTYFSALMDLSGQTRGAYFIKISLDEYFTTNQIIVE